MTLTFPTFTAGMVLSMSLIMAIGPQNAHVLRMGLQRQHLWLTIAVCALADIALIAWACWAWPSWAACRTSCTAR
jgi:L-lysine exporter family protein LysE/ArgO